MPQSMQYKEKCFYNKILLLFQLHFGIDLKNFIFLDMEKLSFLLRLCAI